MCPHLEQIVKIDRNTPDKNLFLGLERVRRRIGQYPDINPLDDARLGTGTQARRRSEGLETGWLWLHRLTKGLPRSSGLGRLRLPLQTCTSRPLLSCGARPGGWASWTAQWTTSCRRFLSPYTGDSISSKADARSRLGCSAS